ncbi:MAG: ATP synthase F1 subunit delta [Holosporales bacterium]|nr:ATP synthase F1 subunit delta [Holosporales bacterium]
MNLNNLNVLFTSLPGRYAKALFCEGKKTGCLDDISGNFEKLGTFFKNNLQLRKLLTSDCLNKKDLDSCWLTVGEHLSFCPVFIAFTRQLVANRRFGILNRIQHVFGVAFAKYKNKRSVIVSSVVELLPEQKERVENIIAKAFKEKAIIRYKVNEKILAGIKIASEELVIDASAAAQLEQLSRFYKTIGIEDARK